MTTSYYDLLGVPKDASTAEIRDAFRERIKETHPDVSDAADASERTQRLIDAKDVLTDETERQRYDRLGHQAYVEDTEGLAGAGASWSDGDSGDRDSSGDGTTRTGPTAGSASSSGGPTGGSAAGSTADSTAGPTARTGNEADPGPGAGGGPAGGGPAGGEPAGGADEQVDVEDVDWQETRRSRSGGGDGSVYYAEETWRAWESDRAYTVRKDSGPFHGQRIPPARTLVVVLTTFMVYPVLLWGLGIPEFSLVFKLPMGLCAVFVVAYLQSMPTVGAAVFGWWTLLLPFVLPLAFGISPVSVLGAVMILGSAIPLGLSLLTRAAIRG